MKKEDKQTDERSLDMIRRYLRASSERFEIELGMTLDQFNESSEKFEQQRRRSQEQLRESSEKFEREMEKSREHLRSASDKFLHEIEKSQANIKSSTEDPKQENESEKTTKKTAKSRVKLPGDFKFDDVGFVFTEKSYNKEIKNPDNTVTNIDVIMENDDIVLAIEYISKPDKSDIDEHIERVELLQRIARRRNDFREYRGAIAGAMSRQIREYIAEKGLLVVDKKNA